MILNGVYTVDENPEVHLVELPLTIHHRKLTLSK